MTITNIEGSHVAAIEQASLYYREGSSDKVYLCSVEAEGSGFSVRFAYGRRGSTLTTGAKTKAPVSRDDAVKVFTKLVSEKVAKGYKADPSSSTVIPTAAPIDLPVGIAVPPRQQLNKITVEESRALIADADWGCQPKFDGRCLTLVKRGSTVVGFNKLKKIVAIPAAVEAVVSASPFDMTLDCEVYTERVVTYDCTFFDGRSLIDAAYRERLGALSKAVRSLGDGQDAVRLTATAFSRGEKETLIAGLRAASREGVVFKRLSAVYNDGRPASGGNGRKLKFWKSCTVRIASIHPTKASVGLEMLADDGAWVTVGNAKTKPAQIVQVGNRAEIRYLYAFDGGSLFQPELKDADRTDETTDDDCRMSQLEYKVDDEAAA
jgi:bifunctional non-homologous end joining protein LigD